MNPSACPPSSLSLGAGSSAIDHGRGARRRRRARPPSFAALSPSRHNNTLSCSYRLRLTDRASEMRAHFLSCHSHPSPPSYPRTLTPQAMPVVLRTDPELATLCHCVLHLFTAGCGANRATAKAPQRQRDEVMLHRRPASPCCACLPAPAARCGLGSLWAASAVSGQFAAITAWCSVSTGVTDRPCDRATDC